MKSQNKKDGTEKFRNLANSWQKCTDTEMKNDTLSNAENNCENFLDIKHAP